MPTYKIVRCCANENSPWNQRVIKTGLSLHKAQDYCRRKDTHGTEADGSLWFDGYEEEA